jgi:pantothenate synthetase
LRQGCAAERTGRGGGCYQAVDAMSLEAVHSVRQPTVFVVAAKFGSVRLIDNMMVGQ